MNLKPPRKITLSTALEATLICAQILVLISTRLMQRQIFVDDAYIHFRCALNWIRGEGMVFNPGEWVLGTTSPVFTFLLALLGWITRFEIPNLAQGINFLADIGIMLFSLAWLRRAKVDLFFRHALLLILAIEPTRMFYSAGGMEMSLFLFIVLAVFESFYRDWPVAGGLMLGALGWIRPEGAIAWCAVAVALIATRRWRVLGIGYASALVVAAVIAGILFHAYGSFIPQSLRVKAVAPWYRELAGDSHIQFFINLGNLTPFQPLNGFQASWGTLGDKINSSLLALAEIAMMSLGVFHLARRQVKFGAIALGFFMAGYYFFYAIPNPQIFRWYYAPYFWCGLFLAGIGWWSAWEMGSDWIGAKVHLVKRFPRHLSHAFTLLFLLLSSLTASGQAITVLFRGETPREGLKFRFMGVQPGDREPDYIRIARTMNSWIVENQRVGCLEIGIFGYCFKGKVLDSFGLVSPEVLKTLQPEAQEALDEPCRKHPLSVFMTLRPEFIMSARLWLRDTPPSFRAIYDEIPTPGWSLRLFVRKDVGSWEQFKVEPESLPQLRRLAFARSR